MSEIWLITRSLTNEIASNLTIEQALKNDNNMTESDTYKRERFGDPLRIKEELNLLGINCSFKPAKELISSEYKNLPKIAMDCLSPPHYLPNHINNLNALKKMGVKVINDPKIHEICIDKSKYQKILEEHNLPNIKSLSISLPITEESNDIIESINDYPVVVKPVDGALGRGVTKCYNANDIWIACLNNYKLPFKPKKVIIQKWIDHSIKGVLRTCMINGKVVACSQRQPSIYTDFFYSGKSKNSIRIEYNMTPKFVEYCKSLYHVLDNIDLCVMDILYDGNNYVACDINSPGNFMGIEGILNINIGKMIAEHLASKL
jgi:glutathione synthase/RimK-type ligase-like ATP-grasp enzyme